MKHRTLLIHYNADVSFKPCGESFKNIKTKEAAEKILRRRNLKYVREAFYVGIGLVFKFTAKSKKGSYPVLESEVVASIGLNKSRATFLIK